MRQSPTLRSVLRFALVVAVAAPAAAGMFGVAGGCTPDLTNLWLCLNPVTGKDDPNTYDANHHVNGVFDPCHCYDPCGPSNTCPIVVDAGPTDPGCHVGDGGS